MVRPASRIDRAISFGRALALGALDEGDHPVEERLARIGGDRDDQAVAGQGRAAGHAAPDVRAGLLEHGRGLAGDRGLVDEPDALDDVAVAGDRLALVDHDDVAAAQLGRADLLERAVGAPALGHRDRAGPPEGRRLGPAAGLGDRLGVRREEDGEPQPDGDLDLEAEAGRAADRLEARDVADHDQGHEDRRDLDDEHDRVLGQPARVELADRLRERRPEQVRVEDAPRPPERRRRSGARPAGPSAGSGGCRATGRWNG